MANRAVVYEGAPDCSACEEAEGGNCGPCTAKADIIQELASKWNVMHAEDESYSFRSREDREMEAEFEGEMAKEAEGNALEARMKELGIPCNTFEDIDAFEETEEGHKVVVAYHDARKKEKQKEAQARIDRKNAIEELMAHYGARMARPYEHWNEDERRMEYEETKNDYFDDLD